MSSAILRWQGGFWLVSPGHVPFNSTVSHMNVKDDALAPYDVKNAEWEMVQSGNWTTRSMKVHTGAEGRALYQAARKHIAHRALAGAPSLTLSWAHITPQLVERHAHLRPMFGTYNRHEGQLHNYRAVYSSEDGKYVLHYDVTGSMGSWLLATAE
eukprot:548775-Prymnesium_polylepis.1